MAHASQQQFCQRVKEKFPDAFAGKRVLDIGSLDVNGNNRSLFTDCRYLGIDVAAGPNVDLVCTAGELTRVYNGTPSRFDTIISTECLEHDAVWQETLTSSVAMLKPSGLFLFTCATTGRAEHGTRRANPQDCPGLPWNYYCNLTEADIRSALDCDALFSEYAFEIGGYAHDLYFYGVKR